MVTWTAFAILAMFSFEHIKKFLVAIFVKRQIKLRREWFFSRCFFNDPIACKSLHNKSIKRNRPPAQGRVAADVETQWHQRTWHRDILGHWENIMFVFLPNLRVFIFIHEKWNGHLVKGSQYWTFWSNDFLHSDQIWVMGILSTEGEHGPFQVFNSTKILTAFYTLVYFFTRVADHVPGCLKTSSV